MNAVRGPWRQFLRGVLPYPDMRRRWRMRRAALRLVTCEEWPGDDAAGMEAAQLALLRLLWLQQLTRNAVSVRREEDAVLLARASLETCIVGLYCAYSGDAIADLSAPNYGAAGRAVSYLSDARLGSKAASDSAAVALGELGPDLHIRDLALWLEREHGLAIAARLYQAYYVPLSHLFAHAYAFALMRHVRPDGSLRRRPAYPWTRRSAARLADASTAVLAANIADKSGAPSVLFQRYGAAHLDRLLPPSLVFTVKGTARSIPRRELAGTLASIIEGWQLSGDASRGRLVSRYGPLIPAHPDEPVTDGLAGLDPPAEDASAEGEQQARHRRIGRAPADR